MLLLLFRGIFLVGILSWYSTNVWKMIDGYFKDRFEKYLQTEYEKNPKMRDEVISAIKNDKGSESRDIVEPRSAMKGTTNDNRQIHSEQESCQFMATVGQESCTVDSTSMEAPAGGQTGSGSLSSVLSIENTFNGGNASESEVTEKGAIDKNSFPANSSEPRAVVNAQQFAANGNDVEKMETDKVAKSTLTAKANATINAVETNVTSKTVAATTKRTTASLDTDASAKNPAAVKTKKEGTKRKSPQRRAVLKPVKIEWEQDKSKKKKKMKVKTIILTEEDFKQAKVKTGDYDFSEFENEEAEQQPEGILVSQLPFKPRADIGNLERVTDDEFCPLTLEDKDNCDETTTWP